MNFRGTQKDDPEINLIPLIDVLLVILIFLMVTTTYSKYAELQINLPTADAEKQLERPNEVNVGITAGSKYAINGKTISFTNVDGLSADLKAAAAGKKRRPPAATASEESSSSDEGDDSPVRKKARGGGGGAGGGGARGKRLGGARKGGPLPPPRPVKKS